MTHNTVAVEIRCLPCSPRGV